MTFLPFFCDISVLSSPLKAKLKNSNFSITFSNSEDTEFDNIQTIIYKNNEKCCVVYVGYTVNDMHFMIQVSEQYIKTVRDFGKIDVEKVEFYLNTSLSKKRIPFFHRIFIHEGAEHDPRFYCEPYSGEMFCIQSYKIGEIKTETDFKQKVLSIIQIGKKMFSEYETAIEAENKSNIAKEIGALIRMFFLLS